MSGRQQEAADKNEPLTGWPAVASAFPLRGSETPCYLQRFKYIHNHRVRVFDERKHGMAGTQRIYMEDVAQLPPHKRISTNLFEDGPAPKRREKDLDVYNATTEHESESTSERDDRDEQVLESPGQEETHAPHLVDSGAPERVSVDGEAALPSPTASPRSPSSPARRNSNTVAEERSHVEDTLEIATPRTSTDIQELLVSGRAFAPTNALYIGASPSPLPAVHRAPPHYMQRPQSEQSDNIDEDIIARMTAITYSFDDLPEGLRRYQLFHLFRGCNRSTLSAMFSELENALRFDILSNIPPELSSMVLRHLDVRSVAAAAQVCKSWYRLVDRDELLWQSLLEREKLRATVEDMQRAARERWGYEGWPSALCPNPVQPHNAFGLPVNIYKAVFRRLSLIYSNWMSPTSQPRQYRIKCPDREVITCLEFSEDFIIASTDGKKHLNVYDTQTGVLLNAFTIHEGGVWALKRVGKDTIVSGSTDHTVRVWSLKKNRCTHVFRGHRATVRCLDVVMPLESDASRDYPVILTGSRDTTLRLWRLPGPDDPEYTAQAGDSSDDNPFFLAELRGHDDSVRAVCGHGTVAVSGSYDSRVRVWDLVSYKCKHVLEGHENKVYATIIDPDRNRCLSASLDNHIKVWDLETGSQLYTLDGHTGLVGLLGLRDNTLVSAAADKTLRVWNPEDGRLEHRLTGHDTAILCFDHDRRRVVSGSERHLKLWNVRTGAFVRDLLTDIEHIWQVSFDSRRCIAAVDRGNASYLEILDFDFDPLAGAPATSDRIEEL